MIDLQRNLYEGFYSLYLREQACNLFLAEHPS